jgi:hypothetical protein
MKLTLSLDKNLIEFAHKLARDSNDSISNMVVTMFRNMRENASDYRPQNALVRKLHGYTRRKPLPDKEVMREKLLKKHVTSSRHFGV